MTRERTAARSPWSGSSLVFAAELLLLPTGLVTAGFLTRQLGAESYGLFTLAATIVGWLQWIVNSIIARSAHRAVAGTREWRPVAAEVVRIQFTIGAVFGTLLFIAAPWVALVLKQPPVMNPLRLLAVDLPLYSLACAYRNVLIGTDAHRPWALGTAARWLSRMFAIVLFIEAGLGITGAVLGLLCSSASELLVARWAVGVLPRPHREEVAEVRRALGAFIAPVALGTVVLRTFERADLMMLSVNAVPALTLGHYGAAQNLTVVVALASSSVAPAVLSAVVRHRRDGDEMGARAIAADALRLPFLALPFLAFAAASAPEIMAIIYGAQFTPAAVPFRVLIMSGAAMLAISLSTALLVADDRPWWVVYISVPMLCGLVLISWLTIPQYGGTGAAIATLVASSAGAVVCMGMAFRALRLPVPVRTMLVSVTLTCAVYVGAGTLAPTGTVTTVLKLMAGALATGLALVASGEVRMHQLRKLVGRSDSSRG